MAREARLLINIDVPDMTAGIAFYTAALGLTVGRRFDADFVELIGSDAPIYLLRKDAGTSIGPKVLSSRVSVTLRESSSSAPIDSTATIAPSIDPSNS